MSCRERARNHAEQLSTATAVDAAPSLAASLTELGVSSAKLRELLCDVLRLLPDEEAQDQVADAVHGDVQQLLLAAR
jgi:hypothetical protein